jgi:phosphoribosylamine--glycine ligase
VDYLAANDSLKPGHKPGQVVETLRHKLLNAYVNGKIRVIPRENDQGDRLTLRRDIGLHYKKAELLGS